MVNWRNPNALLHQLEAFVKVVHFVTGIYIWEFVSTLNFEWSIFRGRRQRSWTAALYVACRVTTLAAAVAQMTGFNITRPISCKTWLVFVRILANTSTTLALMLYALRSIAVWQRNIYLISFLIACLVTNVVLWMRLTPDVEWNGETRTCIITEVSRGLPNNASMFATDVTLFRNSGRHILSTMHREGLFWLAIATVVQLLPVMFQTPASK
ncbi:hypothetical protein BC826DRAFT_1062677 [Russula brevipes]|nr:hypothetical protein BC826DRAFT_1062677 [Russula brevipes]